MSLKRREFTKLVSAVSLSGIPFMDSFASDSWSLEANIAECCSCEIPCPCNFGRSTKLQCDGSRLIEITKGHIGPLELSNIKFIVTFEMGKWSRIYADENMNQEEIDGFHLILPMAFKGFASQARSLEICSIKIEHNRNLIKFSSPDSEVEMKPLKGMDGGLIKVDGLPYKAFYNYVQYESIKHIHDCEDVKWSHSGTNGFTSRMIVTS